MVVTVSGVKYQRQQGMIMVMFLLILFVLTLLTSTSLVNNLMQYRMSHYWVRYNIARQAARSGLALAESEVLRKRLPSHSIIAKVAYKIILLAKGNCGYRRYRLKGIGVYQQIRVVRNEILTRQPRRLTAGCQHRGYVEHLIFSSH